MHNIYDKLISLENLFSSWNEYKKGKMSKLDVLIFNRYLEDNIFELHYELKDGLYRHGKYSTFQIYDPKHRIISKASVKDRLAHHIVFKELYKIFVPSFIYHSYSSIDNKGTHLAVRNLERSLRKISKNYTHTVYALKCDIKKFFQNISHKKLLDLIEKKIEDKKFLSLIKKIISSFRGGEGRGLPIGNITSQIFANIYLNELDYFVKHDLKIKNYFRYADDFIIVHRKIDSLRVYLEEIDLFLKDNLNLKLHPQKIEIRKFSQGIDFLGYIILPYYIILRKKTKRRMFKKMKKNKKYFESGIIDSESFEQSLQSYLGILKHCNGYKVQKELFYIVSYPVG